jgi:hypothetical protein
MGLVDWIGRFLNRGVYRFEMSPMKHRYAPQVHRLRHAAARRAKLDASGPIPPQVPAPATSRFPVQYNYVEGQREKDTAILDAAIHPLMEHFDTVQIVATRLAKDGTLHAVRGRGNLYARIASVEFWLEDEREDSRERQRQYTRSLLKDDDSEESAP